MPQHTFDGYPYLRLRMTNATVSSAATAPFLFRNLKAQFHNIRDEVNAAIARVLESQQFILGREVEQFEAEIAEVRRGLRTNRAFRNC